MVGYRSCSFGADGKLPPRTQDFVDSVKGKIQLADTSLWWVRVGRRCDQPDRQGGRRRPAPPSPTRSSATGTRSTTTRACSATTASRRQQHNGFPTSEVVMSAANSQRDGAFALAPGYA